MFDFKKEYKALYQPTVKPEIVTVPPMHFLAIYGKGNPNDEDGAYQASIPLLYGVAYTLKMSYKTDYEIPGFFQYVVPPLEGFWWIEGLKGMDKTRKDDLSFVSLIRLPDFVRKEDVKWAIEKVSLKKKMDYSAVEFTTYDEGVVVQCLHVGPYDNEPETVSKMIGYAQEMGYEQDFLKRYHHEIYIGDPRKAHPDMLKSIIRHPLKASESIES